MLKDTVNLLRYCGGNVSFVLVLAVSLGALVGCYFPSAGEWFGGQVDHTLMVLVCLLFFNIRFEALFEVARNTRFIAIALIANFVLVPFIGYGVASFFLSEYPMLMIGLIIYFMSPCTDWFLSFTRMSKGNLALGSALIPVNMTVQLLLYPFYLEFFTQNSVQLEAGLIVSTLKSWFIYPLVIALMSRLIVSQFMKAKWAENIKNYVDLMIPYVTALLVLQIFASNIPVMLTRLNVFGWLLLAVFIYFLLTFLLSEVLSWLCRLEFPERALLTMTVAARNAPLMLVVTVIAIPNEPMIYATLVIGMLVEFPHLTALRRLLIVSAQQNKFNYFNQYKKG